MNYLDLVITLLDPVVIPTEAATGTGPETLDYIPGSILLGVAAKGLYPKLSAIEAFELFHSGNVKFGDALPLTEAGYVCLPSPLSLHKRKDARTPRSLKESADQIVDFSVSPRLPDYEKLRGGHVAMDGSGTFMHPAKDVSYRTAIAEDTGLADEGRLYGYQALKRGQRFRSRVSVPKNADLRLLSQALSGEQFIGRAKSSEFGKVCIDCRLGEVWDLAEADAPASEQFVWLLSDAWFHDENGLPSSRPEVTSFEISASINWQKSSFGTRRLAPFNATWKARAEERVVVERGSVLRLIGADCVTGLRHVGLGQERGYGLAFVTNRDLTSVLLDRIEPIGRSEEISSPTIVGSDFLEWLRGRSVAKQDQTEVQVKSLQEFERLKNMYASAQNIAGAPVGPTSSQWAGLVTALESNREVGSFLGNEQDRDTVVWGARFEPGEGASGTFRGYVFELLSQEGGALVLVSLAQRARRAIDTGELFASDAEKSHAWPQ